MVSDKLFVPNIILVQLLARYFNTTEAIEKLPDECKSEGAIPERIERVRKSEPNVGVYTSEDPSLLTASRLAVQHIITKHNLKTSANELFKTKQELPEEEVGDSLEGDDIAGGSSANAGVLIEGFQAGVFFCPILGEDCR
jgi:hypothetical protein